MWSAPFARFLVSGLVLAALPARADGPARTIVDLQPLAVTTAAQASDGRKVTLVDLNPTIGRLYLLTIGDEAAAPSLTLEVPDGVHLTLDPASSDLVAHHGKEQRPCPLYAWDGPLAASGVGLPYARACGGAVWVRRPFRGARSWMEAATDSLRATGSAGEAVIDFYKDNFNDTAEAASYQMAASTPEAQGGPPPARLAPGWAGRASAARQLGIAIDGATPTGLRLGTWYPALNLPGVFTTVLTAEATGLTAEPGRANDAYFLAWDTANVALRYTVGTTHPMLGWSERIRVPRDGTGPDGFDSAAPLVRIGMVPPWDRNRLVGIFTGGFKRKHAVFTAGAKFGMHYGFAEDGVVLSTLHAGLMTVTAGLDGIPSMHVMGPLEALNGASGLLVARQTGTPLVEDGLEGEHVGDAGGNWSGDGNGRLLTMRGGACLLPANGTTYLVYGVFTSGTPRDMSASFHAMGCRDAVLLDMNSPILTFGAVYRQDHDGPVAEHLMRGMASGDSVGTLRFVDQPDSRDFFYLVRRGE